MTGAGAPVDLLVIDAVAARHGSYRDLLGGLARQVVTVVPASAQIEAEANCGWCEISYQGRTGFIYKSFINYR